MGLFLFQFGSNTEITSFNEFEKFTGVKSIGRDAFKASSLKSIKLPSSVTRIEYQPFHSCSQLEQVPDLSNVVYFGDNAFYGCTNMKGVADCRNATTLTSMVFGHCVNLEGILLNDSIETLSGVAAVCKSLTWIDLPVSLKRISGRSFRECTNLRTNLNLPNIVSITLEAFHSCLLDSELYAPNLNELGNYVFYNSGIKGDLNLPNLAIIGSYCFQNSSIETITSLGKIELLSNDAFNECKQLTSVILPSTLKEIRNYCFYGCSSLKNVVLPESITIIGYAAFYNSIIENDIFLPNLEKVGEQSFRNTKIKNVISLGKITAIPNNMFEGCTLMEHCTLPDTLTTIGHYVLNARNLQELDIPAGVTSIGTAAFMGGQSLKYIICRPTTPPTLGGNNFGSVPGTCVIYVPDESISAYQAATNWNAFASKMKGISEFT